jgi:hypothetical protein
MITCAISRAATTDTYTVNNHQSQIKGKESGMEKGEVCTVSAEARLMPSRQARVESRKMNTLELGALNRSMRCCRSADGTYSRRVSYDRALSTLPMTEVY